MAFKNEKEEEGKKKQAREERVPYKGRLVNGWPWRIPLRKSSSAQSAAAFRVVNITRKTKNIKKTTTTMTTTTKPEILGKAGKKILNSQ